MSTLAAPAPAIGYIIRSPHGGHGFFYDIDVKANKKHQTKSFLLDVAHEALVYETRDGFHVISDKQLPVLEDISDPQCPHTIVRLLPNTDFVIQKFASTLCSHLDKLLSANLNVNSVCYNPAHECYMPFHFVAYVRDGKNDEQTFRELFT